MRRSVVCLCSQQDQIVAVDNLVKWLIAESLFNPACMQSFDLIQLQRTVVDQTTGKLPALQIQAAHALTYTKRAAHLSHSGRQQTGFLSHQSLVSSRIDDHLTCGL